MTETVDPIRRAAVLAQAKALHDAGMMPVPIKRDGTKSPMVSWRPYHTDRESWAKVAGWFADMDTEGVGVLTGKVSGQLEMLEFEGRAITDRLPTLFAQRAATAGMLAVWLRLAQGWAERTPSGGMHWYYRVEGGEALGNTKLANNAEGLVLIETRGLGGMSITAPSGGRTHASGVDWTAVLGGPATVPTLTAAERDALFEFARTFDELPPAPAPETWVAKPKVEGELRPGDDYNNRTSWQDILGPLGWTWRRARRGLEWTRPDKPAGEPGLSATTRPDDGDNLWVFSTSAGLPTGEALSKFWMFTHLNYDGVVNQETFTLAGAALRRQGYGGDTPPALVVTDPGSPGPQVSSIATASAGPDVTDRGGIGSTDVPWGPLLPIGHPPLPPFPIEVMPPVLRTFVLGAAAANHTPVDATAMLVLAVISTVVMGKARAVGTAGHREELIMQIVVAMPSAERKTAALDLVRKPLLTLEKLVREREEPIRRQKRAENDRAKAVLKDVLKRAAEKDPPPEGGVAGPGGISLGALVDDELAEAHKGVAESAVPAKFRVLLTSATPEALEVAMAENGGRMLLASDESSIFGVMAGRYAARGGGADLDVFLHGNNGGQMRSARITRKGPDIDHARLAIALIVQPAAFDELADVQGAEGRGLLGRLLYSCPPPMVGTRRYGQQQPMAAAVEEAFAARIIAMGLAPLPTTPQDLICTGSALATFIEFANMHEARLGPDGDLSHIGSWAGKYVGAALRIAGILALFEVALDQPFSFGQDGPACIQIEHIDAAIAIGSYLIPHALAALSALGRPEWMVIAERITTWITRQGKTQFSTSECFNALTGDRGKVKRKSQIEDPLRALAERNYIRELPTPPRPPGTPGRDPSPRWEVNPAFGR